MNGDSDGTAADYAMAAATNAKQHAEGLQNRVEQLEHALRVVGKMVIALGGLRGYTVT